MIMGVFSKSNNPKKKVDRNTFDGSFQNNLTMKMGYLYPCLCKEVIPGDTFHIDSALGLRFMPTAFPLQTKIHSRVEYFYVRYRNLWNKWMNYYTGVGSHDGFPVLSGVSKTAAFQTGKLGDYLGLPTTQVQESGSSFYKFYNYLGGLKGTFYCTAPAVTSGTTAENYTYNNTNSNFAETDTASPLGSVAFVTRKPSNPALSPTFATLSSFSRSFIESQEYIDENFGFFPSSYRYYKLPSTFSTSEIELLSGGATSDSFSGVNGDRIADYSALAMCSCGSSTPTISIVDGRQPQEFDRYYVVSPVSGTAANAIPRFIVRGSYLYFTTVGYPSSVTDFCIAYLSPLVSSFYVIDSQIDGFPQFFVPSSSSKDAVIEQVSSSGYRDLTISALPFRAYEQIYNSFYRDDRNNPYIQPNGEYDPNVFIPNSDGGPDSTVYELRQRNWEQDFLTSALPSPQFGTAPLVGLTSSGVATFQDSDGNSYESKLSVGEDGETIVGFSATGSSAVNSSLINLATSGISINDLRGVNALQKYLENTYRRGLRYRDQLFEHHGVDVGYDVLDMPEFLGGFSQTVDVSQINQTSPSSTDGVTDPLGSYAGQLSAVGSGPSVHKFFDEPGLIIGIVSVVPVPCYSQLLPKHFLKTNERLDYYFPEFARLGNQPVTYAEVCPFQQVYSGGSLSSTFGYQRAWYDYLSNVDEVHGDFRTTLNNFVLQRNFLVPPSLSSEFLTVSPESLNDPFTVNDVNGEPVDTILGQIHFKISMERPIPRFNIPSLD